MSAKWANAALQGGGVDYCPRVGFVHFVHVDVGPGGMGYDQTSVRTKVASPVEDGHPARVTRDQPLYCQS